MMRVFSYFPNVVCKGSQNIGILLCLHLSFYDYPFFFYLTGLLFRFFILLHKETAI